ncbi:hypothetical protein U0070_010788, partial [Myodes glareolus]
MLETYRNLISIGYIWEDHNTEEYWQCSRRHARIERNPNGEKKLSMYPHCVKALSYDTHLLQNEKTHIGQKCSKSKQCGKAFAYHSNHQVLKRKHTGKKPYEYSQDDKDFVLYETHQSHKRIHPGEKPMNSSNNTYWRKSYECNQCGKAFVHTVVFNCIKEHILERNPMNVINVEGLCPHSSLQLHKRTHTGEKPMNVINVGRPLPSTSSKSSKKHTGEKPYECNHCGKAFASSVVFKGIKLHILERNPMNHSSLQKHKRTTGEKIMNVINVVKPLPSPAIFKSTKEHILKREPYECNHCVFNCVKKTYWREENPMNVMSMIRPLQVAVVFNCIKTHSREKPYDCNHFGKALQNRVIFKYTKDHRVERTMMNVVNVVRRLGTTVLFMNTRVVKLYECNVCKKVFHILHLQMHKRTQTGEITVNGICGESFVTIIFKYIKKHLAKNSMNL